MMKDMRWLCEGARMAISFDNRKLKECTVLYLVICWAGDRYKKKHGCLRRRLDANLVNALLVKHWKRHSMVNHMK